MDNCIFVIIPARDHKARSAFDQTDQMLLKPILNWIYDSVQLRNEFEGQKIYNLPYSLKFFKPRLCTQNVAYKRSSYQRKKASEKFKNYTFFACCVSRYRKRWCLGISRIDDLSIC